MQVTRSWIHWDTWGAVVCAVAASALAIRFWRTAGEQRRGAISSPAAQGVAFEVSATQVPLQRAQPDDRDVPGRLVTPAIASVGLPPWRRFFSFLKEAIQTWVDDYAPSMGAALSYYTLFSIAPLLLVVISVAGLAFGEEAARGHISATLSGLLGSEGATAIEGLLKSVSLHDQGLAGTLVGLALLLVGAASVFAELQNALDRIWRVPERNEPSGLSALLRARLLSFGLILGLGFLMIVSLIASAALAALGEWWASFFSNWVILLQAVNLANSFVLVTTVFAMIYKIMPSVHIAWRDVWIGAAITAALLTAGKFLISLYIGKSGITSGFGAASSIVVLLVWVYYSAQIFLVGAEFTWVFARRYGSRRAADGTLDRLAT